MKYKIRRNKKTKSPELIVVPKKSDEVDQEDKEKLEMGSLRPFLPFRDEKTLSGKRCFIYDASGCMSLDELSAKRRQIDGYWLNEMMRSLLDLLKVCNEENFGLQRVPFLTSRVFFNTGEHKRLQFAYVPIKDYTAGVESFTSCTAFICMKLNFVDPADEAKARKVYSFVKKHPLVSYYDFRDCLMGVGFDVDELRGLIPVSPQPLWPEPPTSGSPDAASDLGATAFDYVRRDTVVEGAYSLRRIGTGEIWDLGAPCFLGRGYECGIVVWNAPKVSRWHVYLTPVPQGVCVKDADSTNGTYVAGQRLAPGQDVLLTPGQTFVAGGEEFAVE